MLTLEELKIFLNIDNNNQDNFLLNIIDMSVARVNNLCGRNLNYGLRYDIYDGKFENLFFLKNYPVDKILHIKYKKEFGGYTYDLFNGQPVEDNTYLDKITGKVILLNNYSLPFGKSNVQIKYLAGYLDNSPTPENETPKDIKFVLLLMSTETFLKSFQNFGDNFSKRIGLKKYENLIKQNDINIKQVFEYKDEDYETLLRKYKSLKL